MVSLCGIECCENCPRLVSCGGCSEVNGHPFGGVCVAAEWVKAGGLKNLEHQKKRLIEEFNSLGINGLHVETLNFLSGVYVNLEYRLPNDLPVKLLEDNKVYLGNQIEIPGSDRCYGIVGDEKYLLVCEYGCNGSEPEIVLYRKRYNEMGES